MQALVEGDAECVQKGLYVPSVVPELSTARLLTTEKVAGVAVDQVCATSKSASHLRSPVRFTQVVVHSCAMQPHF